MLVSPDEMPVTSAHAGVSHRDYGVVFFVGLLLSLLEKNSGAQAIITETYTQPARKKAPSSRMRFQIQRQRLQPVYQVEIYRTLRS